MQSILAIVVTVLFAMLSQVAIAQQAEPVVYNYQYTAKRDGYVHDMVLTMTYNDAYGSHIEEDPDFPDFTKSFVVTPVGNGVEVEVTRYTFRFLLKFSQGTLYQWYGVNPGHKRSSVLHQVQGQQQYPGSYTNVFQGPVPGGYAFIEMWVFQDLAVDCMTVVDENSALVSQQCGSEQRPDEIFAFRRIDKKT